MRGYYFFMDQSEFTPPVRQSLTDQEISQRLGAATADEAGMLAAMDFLEEQTTLREQDNQATEAWITKMTESSDARAAIALQNLERAKQGLEPLPLVSPVPEFPVFNNPVPETLVPEETPTQSEQTEVLAEEVGEGSAEEAAEVFEERVEEPAEVFEEPVEEPVEEPANVFSEPVVETEITTPVVRGFRLVSAANWIIVFGILAPALAASISAVSGLNFVTSVLAGLVGILVGAKVNVLGLITAKRTNRGLAVASRATFGVFGAIVPGIAVLVAGLFVLGTIAFAGAKYFNNTIVGLSDFTETLVTVGDVSISFGSTMAGALALVAAVMAIFGGGFSRWTRIVIATVLLGAFLAFAVLTIPNIDYLNLAGVFELNQFLIVAPVFALVVSVFTYGLDGESLATAAWGGSRKTLTWPIFVFGFILPLLTYGHMAALLNGHDFESGTEVVEFLLSAGNQISATLLVDGALIAVLGLLFVGVSKLIEALKTLGTNHIGYGLASLVSSMTVLFVAVFAIFTADPLSLSLNITSLMLVPAASWIGALLTETVMRRGRFHDASLTRSYGFYGSFNWVAMIGLVLSVVFALSVAQPTPAFAWLGFLSSSINFSCDIRVAALLAMGVSILFTLATSFPRIIRQQRETKLVEDRRYDLIDVVVE